MRGTLQHGVPGRCWHYMVFCSRCGARPALPLPRGKALCRLHGGRLPEVAERWSRGNIARSAPSEA